jgi:hypothetical protein
MEPQQLDQDAVPARSLLPSHGRLVGSGPRAALERYGVYICAFPGESTVRDLVAGSGLKFSDRGMHRLKGVPDEWRLYAVQ